MSEGSSDTDDLGKSGIHSPSPIAWPYMSTRDFFGGSRSNFRKIQSLVILGEARKERCILPTLGPTSTEARRQMSRDTSGQPPGACAFSVVRRALSRWGSKGSGANARI